MREVMPAVAPEVIIITETNVPHGENISYFGSGHDEAQMVYNFALPPLLAFSILKSDTTKLTNWAKELTLPSDGVCFFNFTASHDGIGVRAVNEILDEKEMIATSVNEMTKQKDTFHWISFDMSALTEGLCDMTIKVTDNISRNSSIARYAFMLGNE